MARLWHLPLTSGRLVVLSVVLLLVVQLTSALFLNKRTYNASHVITLTPGEWASEFDACHGSNWTNQEWDAFLPRECLHEQNSWLVKHNEEMWHNYRFLVREQSIDERYANLVYGYNSRTGLYFHHYKFDTGNPERNKLLEQKQVVGPRVNDQLCTVQLRQMAALLDDLSWRVAQARRGENRTDQADGEASVLDERHFRLARVLDSFGRYEAGHLSGRYHSFGMHDQCVRTQLLLTARADQRSLVDTRYCWTRLSLDKHLSERLRNTSALDYQTGDLRFHLASCLPASCHSRSFTDHEGSGAGAQENRALLQRILDSQYKRPRAMWLSQSLPVESVFCLVDADSQVARMSPGGRLFVGFILAWLGLCVFATLKRSAKHQDPDLVLPVACPVGLSLKGPAGRLTKSFWSHLDLFESWHDFIGTREVARAPDAPVNLDTLNPIKALSGCAVLVSNSILMLTPLNANGLETYAILENNRPELLMVTGILVLDALFVLTSLLTTFIALKRLSKRPAESYSLAGPNFYLAWLYITASRYLRLVPLYFLAFWFKKTVFTHLGSGPNWDHGLNKETLIGACRQVESWLSPLTPMTAFTPLLGQCLPQSWSISNDLVFALLIPPFILMIQQNFKATSGVIALVTALAIYSGYYVIYLSVEPHYRFMFEQMTARGMIMISRVASVLYTSPVYRVPAIFIGLYAGLALFNYEREHREKSEQVLPVGQSEDLVGKARRSSTIAETGQIQVAAPGWPRWFRGFATHQAVIYLVLSFALALFLKEFREYSSKETKNKAMRFFLLNGHFNFSLAVAVIFLRMVTDWRSNWILQMFSMRLWRVLAKLAYPVILIHWDVLYYDVMNITQATLANKWQFGRATTMTYMYTWPLSILIHLVLENPIDKLTKAYLLGGKRRD